jgi:diacylglycerol kinase
MKNTQLTNRFRTEYVLYVLVMVIFTFIYFDRESWQVYLSLLMILMVLEYLVIKHYNIIKLRGYKENVNRY